MKVILAVSGLDPGGGAGVHADIKTARALNFHAASVITALTVQNTCHSGKVYPVEPEIIREQIAEILDDFEPSCVKIGLVPSKEVALAILDCIKDLSCPKVLDPVITAGTGGELGSVEAYKMLLPSVTVTTPNLSEAKQLAVADEAEKLAEEIWRNYGCSAVITGGELGGVDVVCDEGRLYRVKAEFSPVNIHGTGCVYSTSLACYLGLGNSLEDAVRKARIFVLESVKKAIRVGKCFPIVNP